jgi:hypothetical protein
MSEKLIASTMNVHILLLQITPLIWRHNISLFITNSMEQSPSWQANSHLTSQEILCLLWNSKVHYRVHTSLSLDRFLSQMNPSNVHFPLFRSFQTVSPRPRPCVCFGFYSEGFLAPRPSPQAYRPILVVFQPLLIQYIRSYPPYLEEAVSFIIHKNVSVNWHSDEYPLQSAPKVGCRFVCSV